MIYVSYHALSWCCHGTKTLSALLAFCSPDRRWISPTKVQFRHKGLVMQAFDVFFQVSLCMLLNRQQSPCRRLRPHDAHMQELYKDYVHVSGFVVFSGSEQFNFLQVSGLHNSLWLNDVIWRQGSRLTLVEVMTCCLTAPSHYLNQCWLIFTKVQWCSISLEISQPSVTKILFYCNFPGANE